MTLRDAVLTERPTVPRPKITTVDPSEMLATFHAAPRPKKLKIIMTSQIASQLKIIQIRDHH